MMSPVLDVVPAATTPGTLLAAMSIAVVALATTVVFLFKFFTAKDEKFGKEREAFAKEREAWVAYRATFENVDNKLRADFEKRCSEVAKDHAEVVIKMYEDARQLDKENRREYLMSLDEARREYIANVDGVAKKHDESMTKLGSVIDKLAGRLSGRARTH